MSLPQERLPNRKKEIHLLGARIKVTLTERSGIQEIEIIGDRNGLKSLSAICSGLADLTEEQLRTPANHYHLDEVFWGTEKGSVPLTVYCSEDMWSEASK